MFRYTVRRLLQMVLILWVISVITFFLFWATPANPALLICGKDCTVERIAQVNKDYGFEDPLVVQYGRYMSGLVNPNGRTLGNEGTEIHCAWPCFDRSLQNSLPVWDSIKSSMAPTVWLATGAAVLWLFFGVLLGLMAALRKGKWLDKLSVGLALFGVSFPTLVFGYLLIFVFIVKLQIVPFPDQASSSLLQSNPWDFVQFYILPWCTLALVFAALYTRLTRANMIDTMNEDFIRTARAKGLTERKVVFKHGLRAALTPIVTIFGLDLGGLLGGAVITEQIFSIQGLGKLSINAVLGNDLPVIMGVVLIAAFFIVFANIVVDLLYALIDPRVRLS
ncbi:ABC transporter permease [Kribbella deserti]|uniref:ABC transporter permease n=1 Tax=Kribbella deserti TaxID=1926257 RepID=A0ABV6QML1_9ACTN